MPSLCSIFVLIGDSASVLESPAVRAQVGTVKACGVDVDSYDADGSCSRRRMVLRWEEDRMPRHGEKSWL